jgi:hypothetical protein
MPHILRSRRCFHRSDPTMSLLSEISYRMFRPPFCSFCNLRLIKDTPNCVVGGASVQGDSHPLYSHVSIRWYVNQYQIICEPATLAAAKQALKELRLVKRGIANVKRQVMEAKREIRSRYTNKIRKLPLKFWPYVEKPAYRAGLADDLAPLETEQRRIESLRIRIEQLLVQIDALIQTAR